MAKVLLDGENLKIEEVVEVARFKKEVSLAKEAVQKVKIARQVVEEMVAKGEIVYGITTGFGKFADVSISREETELLQRNLIMSHATGVGEPFPEEIARAVMVLRANALAKGYSGIRLETLETLIAMLNRGVVPVIPQKGSVGASGDLAPLAHMVLVMLGEGEAWYKGEKMPGREAMEKAGIPTVTLGAKEGLALINGTQVMTANGVFALYDGEKVSKCADIAAALTIEALEGLTNSFDRKVQEVRPHQGQGLTAKNLLNLVDESEILKSRSHNRVQDAYALRCIPQVHGATKDAIAYVKQVIEVEINSATDNPLIFPAEREVISGGNFHGQPIALAMDFLGIALAELANISERRIERLLNPYLSDGLPAFLVKKGGLNSGMMIAQYTAAALVSENKVIAHPSSVDSIPTSANQEDHVSMGTIGARKARDILFNVENVIAIEMMCAAQGLDFHQPLHPGKGTGKAYRMIRKYVDRLDEDRIIHQDILKIHELLHSGELLSAVEEEVGRIL